MGISVLRGRPGTLTRALLLCLPIALPGEVKRESPLFPAKLFFYGSGISLCKIIYSSLQSAVFQTTHPGLGSKQNFEKEGAWIIDSEVYYFLGRSTYPFKWFPMAFISKNTLSICNYETQNHSTFYTDFSDTFRLHLTIFSVVT